MSSQNNLGAETQAEVRTVNRRSLLLGGTTLAAASTFGASAPIPLAQAQQPSAQPTPPGRKPNILMIMADDIGWLNVSAYNHGIMGYRTPNIDRIAKEGTMFTDWYGEQSCTAGRAVAFERGDESIDYKQWMVERAFVQVPMQALAATWLTSFQEFPPARSRRASISMT